MYTTRLVIDEDAFMKLRQDYMLGGEAAFRARLARFQEVIVKEPL